MSSNLKEMAAKSALDEIREGTIIGIGTGSTAEAFIHALAEKVSLGFAITGVPTSERTHALCEKLGIALTTLEEHPRLDVTIDGADEISPELDLVKGAGGALLREKIVASASERMVVIADQSKMVDQLGDFGVPLEVTPFGLAVTHWQIAEVAGEAGLECELRLRLTDDGETYLTDGGNYILDASFGLISSPQTLAQELVTIPGIVETGLFTGLATRAIVASESAIKTIEHPGR